MITEAQNLIDQVFALPTSAREEVLAFLIKSIDSDPEPTPDEQAAIDLEWQQEIGRRVADVHDGRATLLDGDEAIRGLRQKFGD